jgi:hypothetical protein
VPSQNGDTNLLETVRWVTGAFAGLAALVYLTGGLALQLRLGLVELPSSAAVPELPREFLISIGLLIVAPAIALGVGVGWLTRRVASPRFPAREIGIAAAVLGYLGIAGLVVFKDPFPAKLCLTNRSEEVGVLIGETSNRTYLGTGARIGKASVQLGDPPPRILSIPQSQVAGVVVLGPNRAQKTFSLRCPGPAAAPPSR